MDVNVFPTILQRDLSERQHSGKSRYAHYVSSHKWLQGRDLNTLLLNSSLYLAVIENSSSTNYGQECLSDMARKACPTFHISL